MGSVLFVLGDIGAWTLRLDMFTLWVRF